MPLFYRRLLIQVVFLIFLICLIIILSFNIVDNLRQQGISSGFGFLAQRANFTIIQTLIPYEPWHSYGRVFIVGILNTLILAILAIPTATFLGIIVVAGYLSHNPVLTRLSSSYTAIFINIPLLLWIFAIYKILILALPVVSESWQWGDIYLNRRGLYIPWGSVPVPNRFNIEGGLRILPEFLAMWTALSCYGSAFIAQQLHAGINAIPMGQWQAAHCLGLNRWQQFRFVILPQAIRAVMPGLSNQYINILKDSSLGAAIGYPELVQVFAGTSLNQTGQALEIIFLTTMVYLFFSLLLSAVSTKVTKV